MKNSAKNTFRLMYIIMCTTILVSCSDKICPTYMNSMQKVKSIRGQNTENPIERKTIPSPYNNEYKDHLKKKYLVTIDALLADKRKI